MLAVGGVLECRLSSSRQPLTMSSPLELQGLISGDRVWCADGRGKLAGSVFLATRWRCLWLSPSLMAGEPAMCPGVAQDH